MLPFVCFIFLSSWNRHYNSSLGIQYVGYVIVKPRRFILLETQGPCVLSINLSTDPCRWGYKSKSSAQTEQAVEDSEHPVPPGSEGQSKEKGRAKSTPEKQHRNRQELLKALFCLDTTADPRLSPALEKQAFIKTLQIGFHRLLRLFASYTRVVLLSQFPSFLNLSDLCCFRFEAT